MGKIDPFRRSGRLAGYGGKFSQGDEEDLKRAEGHDVMSHRLPPMGIKIGGEDKSRNNDTKWQKISNST